MLNTLLQGSKGVAQMVRVNSNIYLNVISIEHAVEIVGLYRILKRCNIKSKQKGPKYGSLWDTKLEKSGRSITNDNL